MNTYRVKLRLRSSFLTPWQADSIFGALCWAMAHNRGPSCLDEFLQLYSQGTPPLVVSNGFPGDLLPRPNLPLPGRPAPLASRTERLAEAKYNKQFKERAYVSPAHFELLIRGFPPTEIDRPGKPIATDITIHTQVDRYSGRAAEALLYSQIETVLGSWSGPDARETPNPDYLSIYLLIAPAWVEEVERAFMVMAAGGFGKRKSTGKGAFEVSAFEPSPGWASPENANAFVSLSNFVPAASDPTEGWYKLMVKRGKLGEEFAVGSSPFKTPLFMLQAGSAFLAARPVREFYGRMVSGLSPAHPEAVHYGLAFAVPALVHREG